MIFTGLAAALAVTVLLFGAVMTQKIQTEALGGVIPQSAESESLVLEETDRPENDIPVEESMIGSDLLKKETVDRLLRQYSGSFKILVEGETVEFPNPLEQEIMRLAESAESFDGSEPVFDYVGVENRIREQVAQLAEQWNRRPIDSVVISYDKNTGIYTYSEGVDGRELNQERLSHDLITIVKEGDFNNPAIAGFSVIEARTSEQAREQYQVIGTFTTKLTENNNRNKNVTLAAESIDGRLLNLGEEFSFNETTGNRTTEKGYRPAGAYRNGILIEEPGGGVCQVSTTLYHAIIKAGFKTTERNAHSFAPSYVEKGQDAMVSFDGYAGPDLKFINTGPAPVVLRASVQGYELKLSIVGLPILENGVKVIIRSEKIKDSQPTAPVYEENPQLPFGTERIVESGTSGSVWKSYRVISKNGEILEEEPLHNSYYKSKAGKIERNTTNPLPEAQLQESGDTAAGQSNAPADAPAQDPNAGSSESASDESASGEQGSSGTGDNENGASGLDNAESSFPENGSVESGNLETATGPGA